MIPWAMTDKGASWEDRSKTSLRIIAARDRPRTQVWNLTLLESSGLVSRHLEYAPEVVTRQLQSQVFVGATTPTLPRAKRPTIPVQTLQVQQTLRHRPVSRLVHPQHAVHTLHGTAGPHRLTEHIGYPPVRLRPVRIQPLAHHLLHQVRHMAGASDRPVVRSPRSLAAQPPQPH